MTTVSHVLGDVTRWDHVPTSYAELNDAFLNGPAGADLNCLCGLANQTPIVLGFVTSDDPMYVTFAHSPQRYPALGHHYDDQFFAFVGNDCDSTMALRLRVPETTAQVNFRTLSVANHHSATSSAGAPLFQSRRDLAGAAAVGQQDFFCRRILIVPPRSWPALLRSLPRYLHSAFPDRGELPGELHSDDPLVDGSHYRPCGAWRSRRSEPLCPRDRRLREWQLLGSSPAPRVGTTRDGSSPSMLMLYHTAI